MGAMLETGWDNVWLCVETDWGRWDYLESIDIDDRNIEDKEGEVWELSQSY